MWAGEGDEILVFFYSVFFCSYSHDECRAKKISIDV